MTGRADSPGLREKRWLLEEVPSENSHDIMGDLRNGDN